MQLGHTSMCSPVLHRRGRVAHTCGLHRGAPLPRTARPTARRHGRLGQRPTCGTKRTCQHTVCAQKVSNSGRFLCHRKNFMNFRLNPVFLSLLLTTIYLRGTSPGTTRCTCRDRRPQRPLAPPQPHSGVLQAVRRQTMGKKRGAKARQAAAEIRKRLAGAGWARRPAVGLSRGRTVI